MSKDSGYLVELKDGRVGRTYHRNNQVNGKIQVTVIAESATKMFSGEFIQEKERSNLLCAPGNLKVIGMAD